MIDNVNDYELLFIIMTKLCIFHVGRLAARLAGRARRWQGSNRIELN